MKNFKNYLAGIILIGTMASSTFATGGILVGDATGNNTPTCQQAPTKEKFDSGIVVAGFTGIVVAGFTGIVVAGLTDESPEIINCGIVVAG